MTNTISSGEGFNLQQMGSSFQVVHATLGRLRLRANDISLKPALKTFAEVLRQQEGVNEVQIHQQTGSLVVKFDENKLSQSRMLASLQQLGVSQAPTPEEKNTDPFAAWKSVDFWKEQGLDFIPLATGLAVTGGLGISGLAAIPVYMIAAEATRQAIDLTRDAWLELKEERLEDEGVEGDEETRGQGDKGDKENSKSRHFLHLGRPQDRSGSKIQNLTSKIPTASEATTSLKIVHAVAGRVRFNVPRLAQDPAYAQQVQKLLKADAAIASFRVNRDAASILINYKPSEGISTSHWIDLLQTVGEESVEQNSRATVPTEQKTETSQPVLAAESIDTTSISESDSIDVTFLPQAEGIKAVEKSSLWAVMKSPALNLSLACMANFPLETVPE
ncbi:MAG TPA: hypothetical protein DEV81_08465 [Cyanobacteria bacterium UBA11049]|nr:hypothetical protein [Cyanobacteria bacterium UBA11049]